MGGPTRGAVSREGGRMNGAPADEDGDASEEVHLGGVGPSEDCRTASLAIASVTPVGAASDPVPTEDALDYSSQLEVVKRLKASGADPDRVRTAAARLGELKRQWRVPRGTHRRKEKVRAKQREAVMRPSDEKDGAGRAGGKCDEVDRDAAAVGCYPPPDAPPLDAQGFVVAFDPPKIAGDDDDDASMRFFERYGFVVYRGVLSPDECAATRDEVWDYLERIHGGGDVDEDAIRPPPARVRPSDGAEVPKHRGQTTLGHGCAPDRGGAPLRRGDPSTYHALSSVTYGLAPEPAVFTKQCVSNRQNPKVAACLARTLRCANGPRDIIVSQDRWCVYRPTKSVPVGPPVVHGSCSVERNGEIERNRDAEEHGGAKASGVEVRDMPEWRTRGNLHLDLNPWTYNAGRADAVPADELTFENLRDFSKETNAVTALTGPHVQGVVSLLDNRAQDGGTVLVPGFHSHFDRWAAALGDWQQYVDTHDDWQRNRLVWRGRGAGSFKFGENDKVHALKCRVPMREGSMLIWDQRVVHGAMPNESERLRMAQFIKAFKREGASKERLTRRAKRVREELDKAGLIGEITPLGRRVFGMDAE